jgi:hypothetical protein
MGGLVWPLAAVIVTATFATAAVLVAPSLPPHRAPVGQTAAFSQTAPDWPAAR